LPLATGPGRCRRPCAKIGPAQLLILFSNFVFHFKFLEIQSNFQNSPKFVGNSEK
jgi:hypothetical protein